MSLNKEQQPVLEMHKQQRRRGAVWDNLFELLGNA